MGRLAYRLDAGEFMRPCYRISPFRAQDLVENVQVAAALHADDSLDDFLLGYRYAFTYSGRSAISAALDDIQLAPSDTVTVLTTSSNRYVSSCVTDTIEARCRWNRTLDASTTAILVVHEFGAYFEDVGDLRRYGCPIIEDYAHSLNSFPADRDTVQSRYVGDYLVFSLPKFFPVQYGGIVASRSEISHAPAVPTEVATFLRRTTLHYLSRLEHISARRLNNYAGLCGLFETLGCTPFFKLREGEVPGAFVFRVDLDEHSLAGLKEYAQHQGIESSVFYGERAFFVPCHQNLNAIDLQYFYDVVSNYVRNLDGSQ